MHGVQLKQREVKPFFASVNRGDPYEEPNNMDIYGMFTTNTMCNLSGRQSDLDLEFLPEFPVQHWISGFFYWDPFLGFLGSVESFRVQNEQFISTVSPR